MGKRTPAVHCTPENCGDNFSVCGKLSTYNRRKCRCVKCRAARNQRARETYEANRNVLRERCRNWREANREYAIQKSRDYWAENREKLNEQRRTRRANDPSVLERENRWREENADHVRERRRRYEDKNRDKLRKQKREWRESNLEERRAKDRESKREDYKNNREKRIEESQRYYYQNYDAVRAARRVFYYLNREEILERQKVRGRELFEENPEKYRLSRRKHAAARRAREREAFVEHVDPAVVFDRDCYVCQKCGIECPKDARWPDREFATVDHIIPLSWGVERGGVHSYANVQTMCWGCNREKGDRET